MNCSHSDVVDSLVQYHLETNWFRFIHNLLIKWPQCTKVNVTKTTTSKNRNLGWAKILLWFVTLARPKIHHCVQTHLWFCQDYNNCSHDELLVEHDQELLKIANIKLFTIMPVPECRSVVRSPLYLLVNQFVTVENAFDIGRKRKFPRHCCQNSSKITHNIFAYIKNICIGEGGGRLEGGGRRPPQLNASTPPMPSVTHFVLIANGPNCP